MSFETLEYTFGKNPYMKKFFPIILLLASCQIVQAQYSLVFCEDVTPEGKPTMVSNSFMVDGAGGVLKFLLRSDDKLNTEQLDFRIFYMNDSGIEEEISRMPQKVGSDWNYVWKEVVMFDPGTYKVKVYTGKGTYLTSANLSVKGR